MPRDAVGTFRNARAVLAESLWWDAEAEAVRWCDITAGTLHTSPWGGPADGSADAVSAFGPPLASFQPAADGGVVAAFGATVERVAPDGRRDVIARVAHRHPLMRLNEGKCDPFGAFVVGSMDLGGDADAALYRVRPDGRLDVLLGGLGTANGFEWSDDGRTFFFTDTAVKTVYRAPYDPTGPLGEPEPLLVGRSSDGLSLDTDGCFWNGIYGEGRVVRWSPEGEILNEIDVPAPNVTSVAFAGPDLGTLLVASARENASEQQLERAPLSGGIFALDVGATGRPVHAFGTR
ncbi:MAG: SMP-30/gluconolactonase/LRE family protein [Micrococcales bacterium]|nr:SMP-30/gluconolactonase/LRE family protein [Micrococcales bacterium]